MAVTVRELAGHLGADYRGDGERRLERVAPLDRAGVNDLSFLSDGTYRRHLAGTAAGAVLISAELADQCPTTAIVVADPYLAYARAAALLHPLPWPAPGVHPRASVDPGATLGPGVAVGANAVIEAGVSVGAGSSVGPGCFLGEAAQIGERCRLHANVTVYHRCRLGDRVVVHSAAVIGSDGFGFANDGGNWIKIPQLGIARIGDDCEIGAGTTIDRGALQDTVIEHGVILDNQIQVAHNVRVGAHTAIAGCVGIAGSADIGCHCRIGGGAGILGHLSIADHVQIAAMSLVTRSITEPGSYASGTPLQESRQWRRNYARFRQLDAIARRVSRIEQREQKPDE